MFVTYIMDEMQSMPVDFYGAYFYPGNRVETKLEDWQKEAILLAAQIDLGDGTEEKLQLLSDLLTEKGIIPKTKEEVQEKEGILCDRIGLFFRFRRL